MNFRFLLALLWVGVVVWIDPAFPQQLPTVRISPRDRTVETLAGQDVQIFYGRPYRKGRKIFGDGLRYGELWRTGADEATQLSTEATLTIGDLTIPPGNYSLFTIPKKDRWTLIINKDPHLMGKFGYSRRKDLGRVSMSVERTSEMIEQLTIEIEKTTEKTGILKISWETTVASVPISAK